MPRKPRPSRAVLAERSLHGIEEVELFEMRTMHRVTQAAVAEAMGITQGAVSQFERARDWKVSSLESYLSVLGAEIELIVSSSGKRFKIKRRFGA